MTRLKKKSPLKEKRLPRNPMEAYLRTAGRSGNRHEAESPVAAGTSSGRSPRAGEHCESSGAATGRARSIVGSVPKTRLGPRIIASPETPSPRRGPMTLESSPRSLSDLEGEHGRPPKEGGNAAGDQGRHSLGSGQSVGAGLQRNHQRGKPQEDCQQAAVQSQSENLQMGGSEEEDEGDSSTLYQGSLPVPAPRVPPTPSPRKQGHSPPKHQSGASAGAKGGPVQQGHLQMGEQEGMPEGPMDTLFHEEDGGGSKQGLLGPTHGGFPTCEVERGGLPEPHWKQSTKSNHDLEMYNMMKALPTRAEIEDQLNSKLDVHTDRLEGVMRHELKAVQDSLQGISQKIEVLEAECGSMKEKLTEVKTETTSQKSQLMKLALNVMDLENRHRRNNIRFRGIPESVGDGDLKPVVINICKSFLKQPPQDQIEIDRVHRVPSRKGGSADRPRDVLCRIHFFSIKEEVMRAAWDKGAYDLEGKKIILLQDLSSKTLRMRRVLKPLLEAATKQGASYRWGYPFAVTFRLNGKYMTLRTQEQLPTVFEFLGLKGQIV